MFSAIISAHDPFRTVAKPSFSQQIWALMDWKPISEVDVRQLIDSACERMDADQRRVWEKVRVTPEKWNQEPWGNEGKGFWVVALIGRHVIWYNDIEDGFNLSSYESYGTIEEYWCNQDQLEWTIQIIIDVLHGSSK